MRVLLAIPLLLAASAFVPAAEAGCLATVAGLCVRDPGTDPCASLVSCGVCLGTLGACADLEACLAGDMDRCVDPGWYCLYSWCDPGWD